jgi:hypothetical protein
MQTEERRRAGSPPCYYCLSLSQRQPSSPASKSPRPAGRPPDEAPKKLPSSFSAGGPADQLDCNEARQEAAGRKPSFIVQPKRHDA